MAGLTELIVNKLNRLDSIPKKFLNDVEKSQYQILDIVLEMLSKLSLDSSGNVKMNISNLRLADKINEKLSEVFLRSDYIEAVTDFASSFDIQKNLADKYFEKAFPDFTNNEFADGVFNAVKKNAVETLSSSTIKTRFLEPLKAQIDQIVTSGMSFKDAAQAIREYAIGDGENVGKLMQYSKQIAYDSIATADRAYTSAVAEDLGAEWFFYAGGLLPTSRKFCIKRDQQYYHYLEVESWAKEDWQGKMQNTTAQNIYENLGGYNCNHSLIPVSIDQVPSNVVIRNKRNGNYEPTKFDVENLVSLQND